ncbi:MAG: polyphosphate kinase 1 [Chitinophagales bacterium]|nr:polyphosphate kinase 1 [Chitinophagales bacterium]
MSTKFVNREISWLNFNERVLQEAEDNRVPLGERLKFIGIFSSNRDEFFRVRVATLRRMVTFKKQVTADLGINPVEILSKVEEKMRKLQKRFDKAYLNILKDLEKERIFIVNEKQLNVEEGEYVKSYFRQKVRMEVFPFSIQTGKEFPALQDSSIYLALRFVTQKDKDFKYWLIEVPNAVPRFLVLPKNGEDTRILFLDDVIRYNINDIFQIFDLKKVESYTIKFTRDAELDIDNDVSQSLLSAIEQSLEKRKVANPLRFIYDAEMPKDFLDFLIQQMGISNRVQLYPGLRYHNFKDFIRFPSVGSDALWYKFSGHVPHAELNHSKGYIQAIQQRDILLYYPYHNFDHFLDLLREAAIDPSVSHIRITLYRLASDSHVIKSLVNAVRNGKYVTVVIELRARFDEASNIYWANKMIDEGIRVITGVPGLKVHSKLCLITRREKNKKIYYAAIGTGNFHEKTAKLYTDFMLLTANPSITKEAREMFTFFERNYVVPKFNNLLVAPFNLRSRIIALINREIRMARAGKPARIFMKLNNLVDAEIIEKLYQASQVGVHIQLIIRGICSLVAGIPEQSDHIQVISIIDKYLEHARVFIFENGGEQEVFIGSADMMARNLDFRVEIVTPIEDERLKKEIIAIMKIQWEDNQRARIIDKDQKNEYVLANKMIPVRSQEDIYNYLKTVSSPKKAKH